MTPVAASIDCASRIEQVVVYARGAQVTRRVTLPSGGLPVEAVDLLLAGVTALAETGSARVILDGGREVVALKAEWVLPREPAGPGAPLAQVRELEWARQALEAERSHAQGARDLLAVVALAPRARTLSHAADPAQRMRDAVAVGGLLHDKVAALDDRLRDLRRALEENAKAREAALLAASQRPRADLEGEGRPTVRFTIRLAPGDAPVRSLALEYAVAPARWWPSYTARLADGGARARWLLEALVAQDSGEDWSGVALALSTADLARDARLPELASLRLGKAQPPRPSGYRDAPEGLDALFEGYDRARAATPPAPTPTFGGAEAAETEEPVRKKPKRGARPGKESPPAQAEVRRTEPATAMWAAPAAPPPPPKPAAAPETGMAKTLRAHPAAEESPPMTRAGGGASENLRRFQAMADAETLAGGPADFDAGAPPPPAPAPIVPEEQWLDFDALVLADPAHDGRRGRVVREHRPSPARDAGTACARIERIPDPLHAQDPRNTRGAFDHRYEAEAPADVPSNALPHRVTLATAEAGAKPRFRTVPGRSPEVFRETELRNPFDAPLLAGPVEVFLDNALLTTSSIPAVDRGGTIALGLGVESRIRVARNTRVHESAQGLLGGSTAVEHQVTLELSSALGHAAVIEVVDRIPVSDEKDVEIVLLPGKPASEEYRQIERGLPVRGGRRWLLTLPPGGKAQIDFGYRITLPAKNEIVGGNRRE